MINRTVLGGRLTKDPELRYTPNGVAVCNFTLAVKRNYKNAQGEVESDFIPHVVYRQKAELAANTLKKGSLINTEGRIQVRTFQGNDGQKRWVTEIIVDDFIYMESRGSHSDQSSSSDQWQEPSQGSNQNGGNFGYEVNLDDDIPF